MGVSFEWDARKAASNLRKHEVSFKEACGCSVPPRAKVFDDPAHSEGERRELIVGHSTRRRLLIVSFVERGSAVRILSARRATRRERRDDEEGTA